MSRGVAFGQADRDRLCIRRDSGVVSIDEPTDLNSDPETAARKLIELAKNIEAVQDGRIYIEKINALFLSKNGCNATAAAFGAGIKCAIEHG